MSRSIPREGKAEAWRRRIQEWRRSGLSVRAYCARVGVSEPTFYAWRREVERHTAATPAFVPVSLAPGEPSASDGRLEIVLADGRRVRVLPGFDAATLRQLLVVLEEEPTC
jgi:transposase